MRWCAVAEARDELDDLMLGLVLDPVAEMPDARQAATRTLVHTIDVAVMQRAATRAHIQRHVGAGTYRWTYSHPEQKGAVRITLQEVTTSERTFRSIMIGHVDTEVGCVMLSDVTHVTAGAVVTSALRTFALLGKI